MTKAKVTNWFGVSHRVLSYPAVMSLEIPPVQSNHTSVTLSESHVQSKIDSELVAGRIERLFLFRHLSRLFCSPLGLVPKKSSGEFRVLHYISNPEGLSVNSSIHKGAMSVMFEDFNTCLNI